MKNTILFSIPLAGDSNCHIQNFELLESIVAAPPSAIVFKLVGSGGISAAAALTYLDIIRNLSPDVERAVISYSSMTTPDFALWLGLAPLRDIRPSAWVWVVDPDSTANACFGPEDQQCFDIISEHTPLDLVTSRIIRVSDLRELLLIDTPFTESLDRCLNTEIEGDITR